MRRDVVSIAGVKDLSNIDLYNHFTTTVWLCGCNLKCPFCHNWKIADFHECIDMPIDKAVEMVLNKARWNEGLVEYIHITGGEPLLWPEFIIRLGKALIDEGLGIGVSTNTNFTLPITEARALAVLQSDALAFDVKLPPEELYGLPPKMTSMMVSNFVRWMDFLADNAYRVPAEVIEVRFPIIRGWPVIVGNNIDRTDIMLILNSVKKMLYAVPAREKRVIVQRLITDPLDPRDKEWCREKCDANEQTVKSAKELLENIFGDVAEYVIYMND